MYTIHTNVKYIYYLQFTHYRKLPCNIFLILSVAMSMALNPCIDIILASMLYDKRILQPCKLSFLAHRCKAENHNV